MTVVSTVDSQQERPPCDCVVFVRVLRFQNIYIRLIFQSKQLIKVKIWSWSLGAVWWLPLVP